MTFRQMILSASTQITCFVVRMLTRLHVVIDEPLRRRTDARTVMRGMRASQWMRRLQIDSMCMRHRTKNIAAQTNRQKKFFLLCSRLDNIHTHAHMGAVSVCEKRIRSFYY